MKRIGFIYGLLFCLVLSVAAQEKVVKLKIVETSDVHGNYSVSYTHLTLPTILLV